MKKIFYILSALLITLNSIAQVQTNLIVSATPPSSLLQWSANRETLIYIVGRPQGSLTNEYKIKTEIKTTDGTVIGRTDLARSRTFTFGGAISTTYSAIEVVPMEHMIFTGSVKNTLEKTGKLPSNTYQICVQLVRPPDFVPISEERCRTFNLAAAQLPILLKPYNEEEIKYEMAKTAIIFRWSPVVPTPKFVPSYVIRVFEVLPHQNPVQAMRSNFPILTQEVRGTTQYIWQPQGVLCCKPNLDGDGKDDDKAIINTSESNQHDLAKGDTTNNPSQKAGVSTSRAKVRAKQSQGVDFGQKIEHSGDPHEYKTYVWTIQSLDNLGQPIGDGNVNGDGVSEPIIFRVAKRGKEVDKLKEEIKK